MPLPWNAVAEPYAVARAAAARIVARRLAAGQDAGLEQVSEDDPLSAVRLVITRGATGDVVLEALRIVAHMRDQLDRYELTLMGRARSRETAWSKIAAALGKNFPQAAEQRHGRLTLAKDGLVRSDRGARAARSADLTRDQWLAVHHIRIRGLARQLDRAGAWWSPAAQDLAEDLAEALEDDARPDSLISLMSLLADDWRHARAGQEPPPGSRAARMMMLVREWRKLPAPDS